MRKLVASGKALVFVYEAGPCGFGIHRWLKAQGHQCWVVSPYVQAVQEVTARIQRLTGAIEHAVSTWCCSRCGQPFTRCGVHLIHAVRIVAELGDLTRFGTPRALMGFLGLVPTEHSSGSRRAQGAIIEAGDSSARRAMVEAAWAYQHPARITPIIARRQGGLPKAVLDIARKAQLRWCTRSSDRIHHSHAQILEGDHRSANPNSSIGDAVRSRLGILGTRYWIGAIPTPQSLERGSSVTQNSLVLPNARISA